MTPGCILAIDDDALTLSMLDSRLKQKGHHVLSAGGGKEGLALLQAHAAEVEAVLLDRRMPGLDGIAVVQHMQEDPVLRTIPVVMLTGADTAQEIREGLDAGVFYYLAKPAEELMLDSVLAAALRETRQRRVLYDTLQQQQRAYHMLDTARFRFRSMAEAESLAGFLAWCFPEPERVLVGLAELLFNAVEHGNLGLGYVEKSRLLAAGQWEQELTRRLQVPELAARMAEVVIQRKPEGVFVQISDMGEGFAWEQFLTIDPARATHNHGRGIAQAYAQSFDTLKYNAKGNQVLAMVSTPENNPHVLEW